jgi:hypothetical protein
VSGHDFYTLLKKWEKQIRRGRVTAAKDNVCKKRWKGMALAVPKTCLLEKGFSPANRG